MKGDGFKTTALVALWSVVSAAAMLTTFLPIGLLAGLVQWWILRPRLGLRRASAIPFALSFPIGQVPSFLMYLFASARGVGGVEGPPEWFVAATLAAGGLSAGLVQFLGLPKLWRNFVIWIPASALAWGVAALGDVPIKAMLVLSALLSGLVSGLAMLTLSVAQPHKPDRRPASKNSEVPMRAAPGRAMGAITPGGDTSAATRRKRQANVPK
jgi:hypothetical protein